MDTMHKEASAVLKQQFAASAPRYYTPSHTESVSISLSEFTVDEMLEYIANKGTPQEKARIGADPADSSEGGCSTDGLYIGSADLQRMETLSLCGQGDVARAMALALIGEKIGRVL